MIVEDLIEALKMCPSGTVIKLVNHIEDEWKDDIHGVAFAFDTEEAFICNQIDYTKAVESINV